MTNQSIRNLKIFIALIFILVFSGLLIYSYFNLALWWQVMTAGFAISFLLIILFLVLGLLGYSSWKVFWLKRDLNKCKSKIKEFKDKEKAKTED